MVIELLCAHRATVDKHYFRRKRYHNVKHLKNTFFDIASLNWKNHELGQQFFFSSLLSLPAGFSSCAMPPEFGSFILFSSPSFSLKYLKKKQVLFIFGDASNIPLMIPWYMVLEARLVHGIFAWQQGCLGNIEWTKNVCLHLYQDEIAKFSDWNWMKCRNM